jgi:hypothetical protein
VLWESLYSSATCVELCFSFVLRNFDKPLAAGGAPPPAGTAMSQATDWTSTQSFPLSDCMFLLEMSQVNLLGW